MLTIKMIWTTTQVNVPSLLTKCAKYAKLALMIHLRILSPHREFETHPQIEIRIYFRVLFQFLPIIADYPSS